ncbi:MAG: prepilin-type N-terminal cleavage/methylation domain-containing protein [Bacillota bacterium]|nr:prepilin-type N-terminal cleavage/methylation domain-containing protein [Bacillota bacterium]
MIKFFSKHLNNKKGFTLIELIVVIVILGILAAIVVPRIGRFRTRAANAAHNANVRTLLGAATTCLAEKGTDYELEWPGTESEEETAEWREYLNSWPTPPKGAEYNEGEETDKYTVEIKDGEIVVTPGLIPEKASE